MHSHTEKTLSLLFIDNQNEKSQELFISFKECFKEVSFCSNIQHAINLYENTPPDIIVMNFFVKNALIFIKIIRNNNQRKPIVLLNKNLRKSDLEDLLTLHINGFICSKCTSSKILHDLNQIICTNSGSMEEIGDRYYCYRSKSIIFANTIIPLTHHETLFLELLLCRRGYLLYYAEIEYEVWRDAAMSVDALKTLVKKLRKKLSPDQLINVVSEGYKLI